MNINWDTEAQLITTSALEEGHRFIVLTPKGTIMFRKTAEGVGQAIQETGTGVSAILGTPDSLKIISRRMKN